MRKSIMGMEYDLINWTSLPSSMKLVNETDELAYVWGKYIEAIPVKPNTPFIMVVNGKRDIIPLEQKYSAIRMDYAGTWDNIVSLHLPRESFEWMEITKTGVIPEDASHVDLRIFAKGINGDKTWFDDLRIYQNDVLIYENHFTDPDYAKRTAIKVVASAITGTILTIWGLSLG